VRRDALQLAARAIERRFNTDRTDGAGSTLRCGCGKIARYAGRRRKRFETVLGALRLERAYYHCDACGRGFCPRDQALGLTEGSLSPGVARMVAQVGALVSFQEGSELLAALAGVTLEAKHVERTAESLGQHIAEADKRPVEPLRTDPPPTLYLGMDGTGIPMRTQELLGRPGKQPDGSAKTREAKLCAIWSAEGRDEQGIALRDPGSVSYSAAIESAAIHDTDEDYPAFAQRVLREAARRGFERARRQVILGDGALWIWNLASEHFPDAIQIVDRFHAKEHLGQAAKAIWGADSALGREWAAERHAELDRGDLKAILRALRTHATREPEARRCIGYLFRNRQRMHYPDFHRQGLCTSTGVLEAGCKVVVATRLKRAGMHWTLRGANSILALRCAKLNNRLDDFWLKPAA
jgi:uncharacterized protein UPF0236